MESQNLPRGISKIETDGHMPKCEQCGKEVDLPFECKFCGSYFCIEHRLPENHNCPNLPPRTPLGSWQTKKEIATAHLEEKTREFVSEGELHFIKEQSEKPKSKKRFPVRKVVLSSILFAIIFFLVILPVYSTYQVEINTFNIQFDKGSLDYYTGTHYYGGNISLNVRFINKAIYSITLRNLNFRLIMIDNELNEDDLLYIPTGASEIPFDMLPVIGNGVTLSPNDYKQIKISAHILSHIPLNFKTIKVYIAIDVSCLWFTRHLSYENPIAGP